MTDDEKRDLCYVLDVTLDGYPATIAGWRNPFATVTAWAHPARYGHEWSWETVARIVANGGEFHS